MSSVKLPERSNRYGVGKEIGGNVYLHRDYEAILGDVLWNVRSRLPEDFSYVVVKHNLATNALTFTLCPDFDIADEPIVGDSILVRIDGTSRKRKQLDDPYIYHHKWLMVKDDYAGFDVNVSKQRSLDWMSLPAVDRTRIGRKSYWDTHVLPQLKNAGWLKSDEIRKKLKLSTCELAHLRESGRLTYRKVGNAYLYLDTNRLGVPEPE